MRCEDVGVDSSTVRHGPVVGSWERNELPAFRKRNDGNSWLWVNIARWRRDLPRGEYVCITRWNEFLTSRIHQFVRVSANFVS